MSRRPLFGIALLLSLFISSVSSAAPPQSSKGQKKAAISKNATLTSRIHKLLSVPEVARGFWGVEVYSLTKDKNLVSINGDKLFTPASNTKLFTTAAVFALIGSEYKFQTTVETSGTVDKYGRLTGDISLVGRGDPNLSGRTIPYNIRTERKLPPTHVLEALADQLVKQGVKFIDGDIIGDDSFFAFERYGEGWSQDDMVWEWGAPVSALTINDNVVFVNILPADRVGDKAFISLIPATEYYQIDNRIMTTPSGTGPRRIYITREPGSTQLTIWGNIPVDDMGAGEALAIDDPAEYAAQTFRQTLEKRGIVINGKSRTKHTELASLSTFSITTSAPALGGGDTRTTPPPVIPRLTLASYQSQPLAQDLRIINKVSQNLHAEIMLRLLGREKGSAGSISGGLEVVRAFLINADIHPDEFVFYDGSGLSRENLTSPETIVKLLHYASMQSWGPKYVETFPVAGVDGSLSERFRGGVAEGKVQAKTGSLGHVNSLSGFATTKTGDRVIFSVMANNHNLPNRRAVEVIDQIVTAIVNDKN